MPLRPDDLDLHKKRSHEQRSRHSASSLRGFRLLPHGIFPTAKMRSSATQVLGAASMTRVTFNTTDYDSPADDAGSQSEAAMADLSNERLIIRHAGIYVVSGGLKLPATTNAQEVVLQLRRTGGAVIAEVSMEGVQSGGIGTTLNVHTQRAFDADDIIELWALSTAGLSSERTSQVVSGFPFLAAMWGGLFLGTAP